MSGGHVVLEWCSYLLQPIGLADFLQLHVKGHPRARHVRVDFTEPSFPNSPAGPMRHELGTFSLLGLIGNRWSFMDPTDMVSGIIFSWNEHAASHDGIV